MSESLSCNIGYAKLANRYVITEKEVGEMRETRFAGYLRKKRLSINYGGQPLLKLSGQ